MDYQARYYAPGLGRFVSADTVVPGAGNSQMLNRYAYVYNNPLRYIDPSGHCGVHGDSTQVMLFDAGCGGGPPVSYGTIDRDSLDYTPIEFKESGYPGTEAPAQGLSTFSSAGGVLLDVAQTMISVFGTEAQLLGTVAGTAVGGEVGAALGWLGSGVVADDFETAIGNAALVNTALIGDPAGGSTYFDFKTSELVVGQSTTLAIGQQIVDYATPASPLIDLGVNIVNLGVDSANLGQLTKPFMETRIDLHNISSPSLRIVIYKEALRYNQRNLSGGGAVKCPVSGC